MWHAPKIDIDLLRDREGITGELSAQVVELGDPALLSVKFAFNSATRDLAMHGRYHGVDIASLGLIAPDLVALPGSHLQFDGALAASPSVHGHIVAVHFPVSSG